MLLHQWMDCLLWEKGGSSATVCGDLPLVAAGCYYIIIIFFLTFMPPKQKYIWKIVILYEFDYILSKHVLFYKKQKTISK